METNTPFYKLKVRDLAARLELHPFDVVRILASRGPLPHDLLFEREDVERVKERGKLEFWWGEASEVQEDPIRGRGLLRSIARELVQRDIRGERATRADNVYRGLGSEDGRLARRALNLLIQERYLRSIPTAVGNAVVVTEERWEAMRGLAEGGEIPGGLARLWLG